MFRHYKHPIFQKEKLATYFALFQKYLVAVIPDRIEPRKPIRAFSMKAIKDTEFNVL
jgi:hypothetical protein